jgi:hypothetical protein
VHDPTDPIGRLLFNVLAMVAEFEADLIGLRTREGMKVAKAKGRLRGEQPKLSPIPEAHLVKLYRAGEHTSDVGRPSPRQTQRRPPCSGSRSAYGTPLGGAAALPLDLREPCHSTCARQLRSLDEEPARSGRARSMRRRS